MTGWYEVVKLIGMICLIFFIGGWLLPRLGLFFS